MFFTTFFLSLIVVALAVSLISSLREYMTIGIDKLSAHAFNASMQEAPKFSLLRFIFGVIISIRALCKKSCENSL